MTRTLGRNDPCHCGSGKKYKRCHLAADERALHDPVEAAQQVMARAQEEGVQLTGGSRLPLPIVPEPPLPFIRPSDFPALTPEEEAEYGRWVEFEDAEFEERRRRYDDALERDDLNAELAFHMLDHLHTNYVEGNDRAGFRDAVTRLRRRRPDLYETDAGWYLSWQIEDALHDRAYELTPALLDEFAVVARSQVGEMFRLIDLLLFHRCTDQLVAFLDRGSTVDRCARRAPESLRLGELVTLVRLYAHLDAGGRPTSTILPSRRGSAWPRWTRIPAPSCN
ncbi:MAG: SEC-C domain-containing protein [Dehalococcoidia bacterium]